MPRKDLEKRKEYYNTYRAIHKTSLERYHALWRAQHPEAVSNYARQNRVSLKLDVIAHYGRGGFPMCQWMNCREDDIDVLTIDHIDDDGAVRRKSGEKTGHNFYRWLRAQGYPEGFQTLCANHQMKKELLRRRK